MGFCIPAGQDNNIMFCSFCYDIADAITDSAQLSTDR